MVPILPILFVLSLSSPLLSSLSPLCLLAHPPPQLLVVLPCSVDSFAPYVRAVPFVCGRGHASQDIFVFLLLEVDCWIGTEHRALREILLQPSLYETAAVPDGYWPLLTAETIVMSVSVVPGCQQQYADPLFTLSLLYKTSMIVISGVRCLWS